MGDYDAEITAAEAERRRCVNCGEVLKRDPALNLSAWISTEGELRGICPALSAPAGSPHVPGELVPESEAGKAVDEGQARALANLRKRHEDKIRQHAETARKAADRLPGDLDRGQLAAASVRAEVIASAAREIASRVVALEAIGEAAGIFEATADVPKAGEWHDDWEVTGRDRDGNAILRHRLTEGLYRILPIEEG